MTGSDGYDKLGKVQPIIEKLATVFCSIFNPHCDVAVDEAMIPFKGRSSLKQYMPKKPVKRGIKVWALADSVNGFISRFEIYTGKKGGGTEKDLGGKVVRALTEPYKDTHRHVYFDNYFTSIKLLVDLLQSGLYGCGTLRTNCKGFPERY